MHLMVCMGYKVVLHCQERMPSAAEVMALRAIGITTTAVAGGFPSWLLTNPERYCAVVVCRYHLGLSWLPLLRAFVPDSLCILDTVDLHHLREQREAELRNLSGLRAAAAITRRHELHAISCADLVWVVSPVERDYLARLLPQAHCWWYRTCMTWSRRFLRSCPGMVFCSSGESSSTQCGCSSLAAV